MNKIGTFIFLALLLIIKPAAAQSVKITPLGSHEGEFCKFDRALILEDPNGTRFLYDAGRTVAGADDKRLGKIDVILVSHLHGDHVGDKHIAAVNQGSCQRPDVTLNDTPLNNSVNIAVNKQAVIITGSEMPKFFSKKLKLAGGDPSMSKLVRFGAKTTLNQIEITTVPAAHSNGISGALIGGQFGKMLDENGITAYAGPPTGYVIKFTNGLVVYLSGDTGMTAEQKTLIQDYYQAKLVVINIGDTFTTGPKEAAFVVNKLIRPNAVIASHANEAATYKGKVRKGTRTEQFINATKVPVYVPLSGKTLSFDAKGNLQVAF
jgi:L-ascorbate metabolism protein UlaG (beta-lactamase superfamily)